MSIQSAVVTVPGSTFMVVEVPKSVLDDQHKAMQTIQFLQARRVEMPIALVTCDERGAPTAYYGPGHLALQLLRVSSTTLLWNELSLT
jgi:hypothetical protein